MKKYGQANGLFDSRTKPIAQVRQREATTKHQTLGDKFKNAMDSRQHLINGIYSSVFCKG